MILEFKLIRLLAGNLKRVIDFSKSRRLSILHNHEMERIQAEAGFGKGFFEGGLVGL